MRAELWDEGVFFFRLRSAPLPPKTRRRNALVSVFWALVAFMPVLLFNVQQVFSLILALISPRAFRRVNLAAAILVWKSWSVLIERIRGVRIEVNGDDLPAGESAVVFANHQSMTDIVMLLCMARRTERLGDMRWMVKESMRYVPFLGWSMTALDFLFLARDWAKDQHTIAAAFARFRARPDPVWLVLFPEGTRKTPEKHAASMERARRLGAPVTAHVMTPKTKGFVASVQGLAGKISAVYRINIDYGGAAPNIIELFSGAVPHVRLNVRRFLIADLPADGAGLGDWLTAEFVVMNDELAATAKP